MNEEAVPEDCFALSGLTDFVASLLSIGLEQAVPSD